jgi:hypothetical protein
MSQRHSWSEPRLPDADPRTEPDPALDEPPRAAPIVSYVLGVVFVFVVIAIIAVLV